MPNLLPKGAGERFEGAFNGKLKRCSSSVQLQDWDSLRLGNLSSKEKYLSSAWVGGKKAFPQELSAVPSPSAGLFAPLLSPRVDGSPWLLSGHR